MPVTETIRDIQTRSLAQMKQAQEQFITYNERFASLVTERAPKVDLPLADRLPKPTAVVDSFANLIGQLNEANRDFATRIASAWERSADADADEATDTVAEAADAVTDAAEDVTDAAEDVTDGQ